MSKKKNASVVNVEVQTGDVFNETDDDSIFIVDDIYPDRDPAVTMCRHVHLDDSETDTEEEWDLQYVQNCVQLRKQFVETGCTDMDVYDIYKLSTKQLQEALTCVKQNTEGKNKKEL